MLEWKKTGRLLTIIFIVLLAADQILKIWVKTHMTLDEAIIVFHDWFQLRFVENAGAAFGMRIASHGAVDWGKLGLSLFRIGAIALLGWYIIYLVYQKAPKGVLIGLTAILAGAVGNVFDSAFYGLLFSESTPYAVAHLGDGYAGFMMGRVVDMFYFPLFRWDNVPSWLSFLVDSNNYFFGAIFNLADAYISVALVYLLLFQWRYISSGK